MKQLEAWDKPSIIFRGGHIVTMDAGNPRVEAVAVAGGRIVALGGNDEVMALRGSKTQIVDLGGRTMLPGLTDPHVHLADDGTSSLETLDVRDFHTNIRTLDHLVEQIRVHAGQVAPGTWIVCVGSPMQDFRMPEKRFPDKHDLDKVAPNNPVLITFGAHVTVTNSLTMKHANVTRDTPSPAGGHIEHDPETGEPTGRFLERAQFIVKAKIPTDIPFGAGGTATISDMKRGIIKGGHQALARGVTTVHDIVMNATTVHAYQEVWAEGNLPVRTSMLMRVIEATIKPESLINLGLHTGFGNSWLKVGGVKMSIDGGITGRAARFYEPYTDDECNCGLIRIPADELDHTVDTYHRAGHRCCVHAIGDVGMDMALTAFEKALTKTPRHDHRHRVEHLGNWMMTPERIKKVVDMQLLPVPNVTFLHYIYESVLDSIGPKRMEDAFPMKRLMDAGIPLTSGSDGPGYWPVDPLRDVGISTSRKTRAGSEVAAAQALSVDDALKVFTLNAAFSGFEEKIKGSIEVGKLADLAVLAKDPFATDKGQIKDIDVDMTVLDGKIVYERGPAGSMHA